MKLTLALFIKFNQGTQVRGTQYQQFKSKRSIQDLLKNKTNLLQKSQFIYEYCQGLKSDGSLNEAYGPFTSKLFIDLAKETWSGKRCILWINGVTEHTANTVAWLCTMVHLYLSSILNGETITSLEEERFCILYSKVFNFVITSLFTSHTLLHLQLKLCSLLR